ncbi:hypothetical protein D3C75_780280 [compost metagenome]
MGRPEADFRRPAPGGNPLFEPTLWRSRMVGLCGLVGMLLVQHAQASTIEAINHTHWAINRFSVEGRSGIDIIGAHQGGGGGCCYIAPPQWQPVVPVPDYTGQKVCGITVHFLPCDDIQVTTSCYAYGSPEYPIKTPLQLPEPQSCPQ